MDKINVILPSIPSIPRDVRDAVESFVNSMNRRFGDTIQTVAHDCDHSYEVAKNPLLGREAEIYASPTGTDTVRIASLAEALPPSADGAHRWLS